MDVLRAAVEAGITHIDTSGASGPHVTNELIREALHPYPASLLVARGTRSGSVAEAFETLAELQQQGLIRQLGVSNVTADQVAEARTIAPIVCVQNMYNLAHRHDDDLIDTLAGDHIAYVPIAGAGLSLSAADATKLDRIAR